ncbi:MAG TPA: sialidase family protein [Bryobacteraceae bacterium]|nr:sialidase family protein [Bryobacteraceae bacterium]
MASPLTEFVADPLPTPSCHASTIVQLPSGDVMVAWFGGTAEGKPDVAIWSATRHDGTWSKPVVLAQEPSVATYNPVLFYTKDGTLWLYYKFGPHPTSWTAARRFSRDDGKTWSDVEHLPAGIYGPIRVKPLILGDGTILSPTSVESYHSWAAWIEESTDGGKTWTKHGPITVPANIAKAIVNNASQSTNPFSWAHTTGIIQPVLIPMGGQKLKLFARSTANIGNVVTADSSDLGRTWSDSRVVDLPNPNAGIDAVRLKDGRLVMIYNHSTSARTPLNLAVSRDGETWKPIETLESEPGEYSYPAMILGSDDALHITYTWKRQNIRYRRIPIADLRQ